MLASFPNADEDARANRQQPARGRVPGKDQRRGRRAMPQLWRVAGITPALLSKKFRRNRRQCRFRLLLRLISFSQLSSAKHRAKTAADYCRISKQISSDDYRVQKGKFGSMRVECNIKAYINGISRLNQWM
jgi:hypothetical protein